MKGDFSQIKFVGTRNMAHLLNSGDIVDNKWHIDSFLGSGGCGEVYCCHGIGKFAVDYDIVVKVIKLPSGKLPKKAAQEQKRLADTLFFEYTLCSGHLSAVTWRPRTPTRCYGEDKVADLRYFVMERLDEDLIGYCKRKALTPAEVASVGTDVMAALKEIHSKGFLFIDVKPQNFMRKNGKVYCIDFGLMERWVDHTVSGIREQEVRALAGSPAYCSLDVLSSKTPSRKDDIESLGLVLLAIARQGSLPWLSAKSDNEIKVLMQAADMKALAAEVGCNEIGDIILYARELRYEQAPDYDHIQSLLDKVGSRLPTSGKSTENAKAQPQAESLEAESSKEAHQIVSQKLIASKQPGLQVKSNKGQTQQAKETKAKETTNQDKPFSSPDKQSSLSHEKSPRRSPRTKSSYVAETSSGNKKASAKSEPRSAATPTKASRKRSKTPTKVESSSKRPRNATPVREVVPQRSSDRIRKLIIEKKK